MSQNLTEDVIALKKAMIARALRDPSSVAEIKTESKALPSSTGGEYHTFVDIHIRFTEK